MWLTIENIPYISLGWIGLGFILLLIGVIAFAHQQSQEDEYTVYDDGKELISFFMEEEEKKNEAFRESIIKEYKTIEEKKSHEKKQQKAIKKIQSVQSDEQIYNKIVTMYKQNIAVEDIAKQMQIGVGEVSLIISLYSMR